MPVKLKSPFFESMIAMPTVAEEGCLINVIAAPIFAPGSGCSVFFYNSEKQASSFKGYTAFSIVTNLTNSKPKYNMILPVFLTFSVFETRNKINPITKSIKKNFHLSVAIICLLTVVIMFATRIISIACLKLSITEFTNTMVITITADEESNNMVSINPTKILLNVLEANFIIH